MQMQTIQTVSTGVQAMKHMLLLPYKTTLLFESGLFNKEVLVETVYKDPKQPIRVRFRGYNIHLHLVQDLRLGVTIEK